MNCNTEAFDWIISVVKIQTNFADDGETSLTKSEIKSMLDLKFAEVNSSNCLNKLVTSFFLQVTWIYERIWNCFLISNFADVINTCRISLNNIN
jgi:hypothetical protein